MQPMPRGEKQQNQNAAEQDDPSQHSQGPLHVPQVCRLPGQWLGDLRHTSVLVGAVIRPAADALILLHLL
jgi:hypothetical protein